MEDETWETAENVVLDRCKFVKIKTWKTNIIQENNNFTDMFLF
jgi:hypothetical protein